MFLFNDLELLTRVLSWLSIPFAIYGILLIAADVFPMQLDESKVDDQDADVRRLLPVLTFCFVCLAIPVALVVGYNTLEDVNGHGVVTNMLRTSINAITFIEGISWKLIYRRS